MAPERSAERILTGAHGIEYKRTEKRNVDVAKGRNKRPLRRIDWADDGRGMISVRWVNWAVTKIVALLEIARRTGHVRRRAR